MYTVLHAMHVQVVYMQRILVPLVKGHALIITETINTIDLVPRF